LDFGFAIGTLEEADVGVKGAEGVAAEGVAALGVAAPAAVLLADDGKIRGGGGGRDAVGVLATAEEDPTAVGVGAADEESPFFFGGLPLFLSSCLSLSMRNALPGVSPI
jgi:hypothetical protein